MSESESVTLNGASTEDKPQKALEKRKPRLNRRGFLLIDNPNSEFNCEEPKPDVVVKNKTELEKSKVDVPERKIISFASVKKTPTEINPSKGKKVISLKRTFSSIDEDEKKSPEGSEVSVINPSKERKVISLKRTCSSIDEDEKKNPEGSEVSVINPSKERKVISLKRTYSNVGKDGKKNPEGSEVSVVNPSKERKVISLKRTYSNIDEDEKKNPEGSEASSEVKPPKKHKPITWP